ncbi:MAG: hypothetical protein ACRC2T_19725 [Thermoguttaceae bacterium]
MNRTLLTGILLLLASTYSGCIGYNGYGPCGPYAGGCLTGSSVGYGGYNPYETVGDCGGMYADSCGTCLPTCNPYAGYPCGAGSCVGAVGAVGCGAVRGAAYVAATPVSWLAQILRGTAYPCSGCSDEVYWGDYGTQAGDYCSPCTYDGQWAGGTGCGPVCQSGLSYRYPAVGSYMNQAYSPVFQDKISATHAKTSLDYGLRGPSFDSCYSPCDYGGCYTGGEYYDTGCSTGNCGTGVEGTFIDESEDDSQTVEPVNQVVRRMSVPSSRSPQNPQNIARAVQSGNVQKGQVRVASPNSNIRR